MRGTLGQFLIVFGLESVGFYMIMAGVDQVNMAEVLCGMGLLFGAVYYLAKKC